MILKIGILTFHKALNYGAVLQAYALSFVLARNGHDVKIIDYYCKEIDDVYRPFYAKECKGISNKIKKILKSRILIEKRKKFDRFSNTYLLKTSACENESELKATINKFDMIVTGSDQVFNLHLTGEKYTYFLDIVSDEIKKSSYAASFGNFDFNRNQEKSMAKCLSRFNFITVREKQGADYIKKISGINCDVALDPVFLLNRQEWSRLAKKPQNAPDKFILFYNMGDSIYCINKLKDLAKEQNENIVIINPTLKQIFRLKGFDLVKAPSPEEFIWFFMNADKVVTNSFHGLAFSLIFEKNFYVENFSKDVSSRITDLLKLLKLESRLLPTDQETILDYKTINKTIAENVDKSINLINKMAFNE